MKLLMIVYLVAILSKTAYAWDNGAYITNTTTCYINPDTGLSEDEGTKNTSIGEGMCRSVIDKKGLIEINNENIYLTLRVHLHSNIDKISFLAQQKKKDPKSYKAVTSNLIQENGVQDYADYRIKIPNLNTLIKCKAYVTPMAREVCFFINTNEQLTAGKGSFIPIIDFEKDVKESQNNKNNTVKDKETKSKERSNELKTEPAKIESDFNKQSKKHAVEEKLQNESLNKEKVETVIKPSKKVLDKEDKNIKNENKINGEEVKATMSTTEEKLTNDKSDNNKNWIYIFISASVIAVLYLLYKRRRN